MNETLTTELIYNTLLRAMEKVNRKYAEDLSAAPTFELDSAFLAAAHSWYRQQDNDHLWKHPRPLLDKTMVWPFPGRYQMLTEYGMILVDPLMSDSPMPYLRTLHLCQDPDNYAYIIHACSSSEEHDNYIYMMTLCSQGSEWREGMIVDGVPFESFPENLPRQGLAGPNLLDESCAFPNLLSQGHYECSPHDAYHWVYECLLYFSHLYRQPSEQFIVEASPASEREIRRAKKGKKLPRYHQRERLLILPVKKVRKIYPHTQAVEVEGEDSKVTPHIRRGHFRRYANNRFSAEVRAKPQFIEALWVGDKEAVHEGVRYKVRLDL